MKHKKLNIDSLEDYLELLETELEIAGAPMTYIRKVHDVEASIKWLKKHAPQFG